MSQSAFDQRAGRWSVFFKQSLFNAAVDFELTRCECPYSVKFACCQLDEIISRDIKAHIPVVVAVRLSAENSVLCLNVENSAALTYNIYLNRKVIFVIPEVRTVAYFLYFRNNLFVSHDNSSV